MKVILVSMPWLSFDRPSIANALLTAYVRQHEPDIDISCRSEHVRVWQQLDMSYEVMAKKGVLPELIYVRHLYPERDEQVRTAIDKINEALKADPGVANSPLSDDTDVEIDIDTMIAVTGQHLESTAEALANEADVIGFTCVYSQLFSSICLAKAVKEKNPAVITVMGGQAASTMRRTLIDEFPFIDYLVCGEGELRFLELLRRLRAGDDSGFDERTGIFSRRPKLQIQGEQGTLSALEEKLQHGEITDLDTLPAPDYSEYYALSEELSILPTLPIEGSRGCWWKQRGKGRDDLRGCYFCGLNSKSSRREKSIERIVEEIKEQAVKYEVLHFSFTDNLVRTTGRKKLAKLLLDTDLDLRFNLEVRADFKASELVAMRRAGCCGVQIGVEGLSTRYLKRMNKGTTTINNLYVMRSCFELDIPSASNLLVVFPQATKEEVDETVENILRYAICYDPLNTSRFTLDRDSAVYEDPASFGVESYSSSKYISSALPEGVGERLRLPWLDHKVPAEEKVDWNPVFDACTKWAELHRDLRQNDGMGIAKPLFYLDGGEFLQIIDRRFGFNTVVLSRALREIYLYCMEIRSMRQIIGLFSNEVTEEQLMEHVLGPMMEQNLIYREGNRFLSLAVAWKPEVAMRRIQRSGR